LYLFLLFLDNLAVVFGLFDIAW